MALRSSSTRSRSRSTKRPGTRQADSPRCKISRPTRSRGATTSGRSRSCARGSQVPVVATRTLSRSPSVCSALPSRRTVRTRRRGSRSRRASRYVACTVSRGQKRRCCRVSPTSCGRRVLRRPSSTTGRASSSPGRWDTWRWLPIAFGASPQSPWPAEMQETQRLCSASSPGSSSASARVLNPAEKEELDATIAQAREALGNDAFDAAWAEGGALSLDQAVDLSLTVTGHK